MRYALVIGVSEFGPGLESLPACKNDAQQFAAVLAAADQGHFDVQTVLNPNRQLFDEAVFNFFQKLERDDVSLFYFSGHGVKDDMGKLYLATTETRNTENGSLFRPGAFSAATLTEYMAQSRARSQIVILDCCFSGAISGNWAFKGAADSIRDQIGQGRVTLASSSGMQYSVVEKSGNLSLYTSLLIEGLNGGKADRNRDGKITADELHRYVADRFLALQPSITPKFYPWETGFAIVVSKAPAPPAAARFEDKVRSSLEKKKLPQREIAKLREAGSNLGLSEDVVSEILGKFQVRKTAPAWISGLPIRVVSACLLLAAISYWFFIAFFASRQSMVPWLTRSADNSRTGWNKQEFLLTQASIAHGLTRAITIPLGYSERGMESQPLILPKVSTSHGTHDVMVLPSMADMVRAVDAHDGTVLWEVKLGTPIIGAKSIDMYSINDHWGCLSTGVIDPDTSRLYQVCWTSPDGTGSPRTARYFMHVLNIANGQHAVDPVLIQGTGGTLDFNSVMRKQRSSLVETNVRGIKTVFGCSGSVYETSVGAAGFCFAFDVASNTVSAMLATTSGKGGGIWMAGQGPSADDLGYLYLTTANGSFDGVGQWGESFLKLKYTPPVASAPAMLAVVDHWTPWTDFARSGGTGTGMWADQDLGSSGPACIFAIGVCLITGKDGIGYPVRSANLGATTSADLTNPKTNCLKLAGPPVWITMNPEPSAVDPCPDDPRSLNFFPNGLTAGLYMTPVQFYDRLLGSWTVFSWGSNGKLRKWSIAKTGSPNLVAESREYANPDARTQSPGGMPGAMCSGSSNGSDPDSAILVCSVPNGNANSQVVSGRLLIYDAVHREHDGSLKLIWDSALRGVEYTFNKFDPPLIDGGQIYVPNFNGGIDVYTLIT